MLCIDHVQNASELAMVKHQEFYYLLGIPCQDDYTSKFYWSHHKKH